MESYTLKLVITVNQKNVWRLLRSHQTYSHNLHFEITGLARRFFFQRLSSSRIHYYYMILRNVEGKKVCPFFLLENSRPLSPWGPLDFLSTCLGIDSLIPPFLLGELCCQGKGAPFSFRNYFLLFRGVVPKLLRQHILLTLVLRVSDPGAPSNSWRRL